MKKITTNTKTLSNAVAIANTYTSKDGDYAGAITLVGNDGMIEVKATDLVQTIVFKNIAFTSSDLTDPNFDAISLDGKKLAMVLKAAKGDEVIVEINEDFIAIKSNKSRAKIETHAKAQKIAVEQGYGNAIVLDECIGAMESLVHAIDQNNPKFELNGFMLEAKDNKINMVATDTRRLAVVSSKTQMDDINIIIPKQAAVTMIRLFANEEIEAETDSVLFSIHSAFVSYSTKLINGKFPDYQRIVPKETSQSIVINAKKLKEVVEEASIFENDVVINIKNQIVSVADLSNNTEAYMQEDENIDIHADLHFAVNSRYILDILAINTEKTIELRYNDHNIPFVVKAGKLLEVIMPIILSDGNEAEAA